MEPRRLQARLGLPPALWNHLRVRYGKCQEPSQPLTRAEVHLLCFTGWLLDIPRLQESQVLFLLDHLWEAIQQLNGEEDDDGWFLFLLIESQFATWKGYDLLLDLHLCTEVEKLNRPPRYSFTYNFAAAIAHLERQLQETSQCPPPNLTIPN